MPKKINNHSYFALTPLLFLSSMFFSSDCISEETGEGTWLPESVQIHGFLSQGILHTSDNNFFGKTDDTVSHDFREMGVNGSWNILPDLQVAMQVVWRDAGDTDNGGFRIDYGLASYNVYSSENSLLTLRGGRVPTPLGFYNDTRDVAATRPSILLPQSIYFDINRNLALSADGGYIYGEHRSELGDFSLNFGAIIPRMDDPAFNFALLGNSLGDMEGDISWVGRLGYEWQDGRIRLAATYADFKGHSVGAAPQAGSFHFNPLILSVQYNAENWSLTGEYALRRSVLTNFANNPVNGANTGQSFYIQGTYHLTQALEAIIRYDDLMWDINDSKGEGFAKRFSGVPAYSRFAQDWTFGLRYEILPSLLLSAEYHRINGTGWISALENPQSTSQHWDLYTTMISYSF